MMNWHVTAITHKFLPGVWLQLSENTLHKIQPTISRIFLNTLNIEKTKSQMQKKTSSGPAMAQVVNH